MQNKDTIPPSPPVSDKLAAPEKIEAKRLATLRNPTIEAIAHGLFRFSDEWQAIQRLEGLKARFIVAREQEDNVWPPSLIIWIRGYALTPEDEALGFQGHFGRIRCMKANGVFTLKMDKLDIPMEKHPQKKRIRQSHPDWGHPVLRRLEKKPNFETVEEARAALMQLHQDFPTISIPGQNHLYIIVYRKEKVEGKPPIQKMKFLIEAQEGGYRIRWEENLKRRPEAKSAQAPIGTHTARVKLKRKPK